MRKIKIGDRVCWTGYVEDGEVPARGEVVKVENRQASVVCDDGWETTLDLDRTGCISCASMWRKV